MFVMIRKHALLKEDNRKKIGQSKTKKKRKKFGPHDFDKKANKVTLGTLIFVKCC